MLPKGYLRMTTLTGPITPSLTNSTTMPQVWVETTHFVRCFQIVFFLLFLILFISYFLLLVNENIAEALQNMQIIMNSTCVRFVPRTNETNYLFITFGAGYVH